MTPESPLSNLLDSVYELEGLIHLALNRDNPPAALSGLILRKAQAIADAAPDAVAASSSVVTPDTIVVPEVTSVQEAPEENVMVDEPIIPVLDEDEDNAVAEEKEEFIPMETVSPDYNLGEEYSESSDFATPEVAPSIEGADEPLPIASSAAASAPRKRGKLVFNLNDRYRFRRSLFHGNDTDFSAALSTAADAATYADAESYFYSVLGWNPEDEEVRAFMQLLENYYN